MFVGVSKADKTGHSTPRMPSLHAVVLDTLETILAARAAASVQCSGCDEKFPSAKIFACKSCTHDAVVSVCGFCAMEEHRLHETVKLDKLATREEVDQAHKEIASYNKQLRLRVEGINSQFEQARLAIDRLVHVSF